MSPYRATRNDVRGLVGAERFIEVYVNTPIEECEKRDDKGLYAKARRAEIVKFLLESVTPTNLRSNQK